MMNKAWILSTLSVCALSTSLFSYDFSKQDALFLKRGEGFVASTAARDAYKKALDKESLNDSERVYAVRKMGLLDIYRGSMIDDVRKKDRKKALEACMDDVELIKDTNHQVYHYVKIACIASRGKLASAIGRGWYGTKLSYAEGAALESTTVDGQLVGGVEAGGILRVLAAVRGNIKAKILGLYNPDQGLEYANIALASEGEVYRPAPEGSESQTLSGKDYFENYHYVGQATIAVGMKNENPAKVAEGRKVLDNTLRKIEKLDARHRLPKGRDPEMNYYKKSMQVLSGKVTKCSKVAAGASADTWDAGWKDCLENELDD